MTIAPHSLKAIRAPGPLRRWIAFYYCQLTQRECEYLALSRDTSETDIKQRREIYEHTVRCSILPPNHSLTVLRYMDQCAVTAAIKGRVLILEGLEKCERNVMPVLNNLLENREMNLDDGRFLVSPKR